ncbi:MAG TPA: hypothetical protein VIC08_07500 [Cellvibrionaceae bacterium]
MEAIVLSRQEIPGVEEPDAHNIYAHKGSQMLYIQEKSFIGQIKLLSTLVNLGDFKLCAWLYPESQRNTLAGFMVVPHQGFKPVTTYEDGIIPSRTELIQATESTLSAFRESKSEIQAHCDSITLYIDGQFNWHAATVGHEGMCLVQDDRYLSQLQNAGFNVSTQPPDWW